MKSLSLPKIESDFINQIKTSFMNTESLLILGEMDFSLASSIANIMSNRYSNNNTNNDRNNSSSNNCDCNVFATSYHNCLPLNQLLNDKNFCLGYKQGMPLFHIFVEGNIPDYNENKELISSRIKISQFLEQMKLSICNIVNKTNLQWHIACGIDATNLNKYSLFEKKRFDKIVFGFPRTKLPYDSANEIFMKKVLNCVKNFLIPSKGELHLLMHASQHTSQHTTKDKNSMKPQFETWKILSGDTQYQWKLIKRQALPLSTLKILFDDYQTRTETGYTWKPDTIEYIIMKPI